MKNSILQQYAPTFWIVAGVLCLLPGIFGSSNNQTSIGIGMMSAPTHDKSFKYAVAQPTTGRSKAMLIN